MSLQTALEQPNMEPSDERPMRIAVVSDAAPHRNGVGAYYQDLIQHISPSVDAITTLCPTIENGKWRGGIPVPLPGDNTQKFMVPNPWKVYRELKAFKPDVVIVPTPGLYGVFGSFLGAKSGARVIVGFHTWYEKLTELYWDRWQGVITKGYFDVSNSILFRYADCVVVNSDFMAETAQSVGRCRTHIVGTPVSYDFIHSPRATTPNSLTRILFAGRLAAEKNLPAIFQAARAHPELQFTIAGDGPDKGQVDEALTSLPNLQYAGWVNRQTLMGLMDSHDALILPSTVESFGTVALESMARGRVTIVSAACGITQWPQLSKGLAVFPEEEGLSAALTRLCNESPIKIEALATRGRHAAVEENNWNVQQWLDLLCGQRSNSQNIQPNK